MQYAGEAEAESGQELRANRTFSSFGVNPLRRTSVNSPKRQPPAPIKLDEADRGSVQLSFGELYPTRASEREEPSAGISVPPVRRTSVNTTVSVASPTNKASTSPVVSPTAASSNTPQRRASSNFVSLNDAAPPSPVRAEPNVEDSHMETVKWTDESSAQSNGNNDSTSAASTSPSAANNSVRSPSALSRLFPDVHIAESDSSSDDGENKTQNNTGSPLPPPVPAKNNDGAFEGEEGEEIDLNAPSSPSSHSQLPPPQVQRTRVSIPTPITISSARPFTANNNNSNQVLMSNQFNSNSNKEEESDGEENTSNKVTSHAAAAHQAATTSSASNNNTATTTLEDVRFTIDLNAQTPPPKPARRGSTAVQLTPQDVDRQGVGWKQCPSIAVIWQERYFVLKKEGAIYYYESRESYLSGAPPKGVIRLTDLVRGNSMNSSVAQAVQVQGNKMNIHVHSKNQRVYKLQFGTAEETEQWKRAVFKHLEVMGLLK